MKQSTDELIATLSGDLSRVEPLGRLREIALSVLGISLPFYLYWLVSRGLRHQFAAGELPDTVYFEVVGILLLLAAGGIVAGLASSIPGREMAVRLGQGLFVSGLVVGFLVLGFEWITGTTSLVEGGLSSLPCVTGAAMLSIPSTFLVTRFILRGAAPDLPVTLALACAGGMGIAAMVVHLTCPNPDAMHLMLGHALAPLVAGLFALFVLSLIIAMLSRAVPSSNS